MNLTKKQNTRLGRLMRRPPPCLLVLSGKHGTPIWVVNSREDLVRAFRSMVNYLDKNCGFYDGDEPHLKAALEGDVDALLAFVQGRRDAEYETWNLEQPMKLPQSKPHNLKVVGQVKGKLDVKRMGLPGLVLRSKCPECGELVSKNMDEDPHRLSYPTFGEPTEVTFYHYNEDLDHGGEWSVLVQWDVTIQSLSQQEPPP